MMWQLLLSLAEYRFTAYTIPPLVTSLLIVSLGGFVLAKDPKKSPNRSFFSFGICLFLWLFGYAFISASPDEETASIWLKLAYAGVTFIPACSYESSLQITSRGLSPLPRRTQKLFLYSLSALFYLFIFFFPHHFFKGWKEYLWGRSPLYGPVGFLFLAYFCGGMILSLLVCRQNFHRAQLSASRNQIRYFTIALSAGCIGGIDFLSKFGLPVYPVGYLPIFVLFSIFSYAIIRHNLMDIETRVHKTLMWATFSILLLVPCIGVFVVIWPWMGKLPLWMIWAIGLVLVILTSFYFRAIHPVIDHLFQQGSYDPEEIGHKLPERFNVDNVQRLGEEMAGIVMESLGVERFALLILDEGAGYYCPVGLDGPGHNRPLPAEDPFILWLSHHPAVIEGRAFQESAPSSEVKRASQAYFARTGAAVCIPLQNGSKLSGIAHLGEKIDGGFLSKSDLDFLEQFRIEGNRALERSLLKTAGTSDRK